MYAVGISWIKASDYLREVFVIVTREDYSAVGQPAVSFRKFSTGH